MAGLGAVEADAGVTSVAAFDEPSSCVYESCWTVAFAGSSLTPRLGVACRSKPHAAAMKTVVMRKSYQQLERWDQVRYEAR